MAKQLEREELVSDFEINDVYPELKIFNAKVSNVSICSGCCVIELLYENLVEKDCIKSIYDVFKPNQVITIKEFNKYKDIIQQNGCSLKIIDANSYRIKFPKDSIPDNYRYFTDDKFSCEDCKYCDYDYHKNVEYCIAEKELSIIYQSSKYICNNFKKKEVY